MGAIATPYLDAVARTLQDRSPGTKGKVWWLSDQNRLPSDWLLQTPDCWGDSHCGEPPPGGRTIVERMKQMIAGARKSVDIAELYDFTLAGYPDGKYLDAIVEGLKEGHRAHPGEVPVLRLLLGIYPGAFYHPGTFVRELEKRVGSWVRVQSGAMQSTPTSWNHAKVWDVDGREAIVGGMNYWSSAYLKTPHPVNDVSMEVAGPAATDVAHFTNLLWSWTCDHQGLAVDVVRVNLSSCVKDIPTEPHPVDPNGIPIMVVGKLGMGIPVPGEAGKESTAFTPPPIQGNKCPAGTIRPDEVNDSRAYEYRNPGETALRALVASAKHSIFISQQDLLSCLPKATVAATEDLFDARLFTELATKVVERVPIKIVLSGGKVGDYSNCCEPQDVASVIAVSVVAKYKVPASDAVAAVCRDVGIAAIRNDSAATWPDGERFRNHAKLVEVDDEAFYIGSGNLYPSRLQELGMIVDNREAAAHLKSAYLDPLWHWSRADAVIDPETKKCG